MNIFNPSEKTAVLFLAFGGPDSPSVVEPFIRNILGEKNISPEKIVRIKDRYSKIGGKSPLLEITNKQAELVENILGPNFKVFVGMRYWHPFIADTISRIKEEGYRQIIAVPMTPYYCRISTGGYQREFENSLKSFGENFFVSKFVSHWNTEPLFLEALVDTMNNAVSDSSLLKIQVIFSVHSVPQQVIEQGDPYLKQINETIHEIIKRTGNISWHLGFQSKGGGTIPWIGPDVAEILDKISGSSDSSKQILLVPVGFISDHVETLYDIDIEYAKIAHEKGLRFKRAQALNDNPKLAKALVKIIYSAMS